MAKVQFNCRLEEDIADWIAKEAERRSTNGKRVSQADVVTAVVRRASLGQAKAIPNAKFTPEIEKRIAAQVKPLRQSKKDRIVAELAASDLTAQQVGREDIEYGPHTELPRGEHVANIRGIRPKGDKTR